MKDFHNNATLPAIAVAVAHTVFKVFFVLSDKFKTHHFTLSTEAPILFSSSTALLFAVITNDKLYCDESAIELFLI